MIYILVALICSFLSAGSTIAGKFLVAVVPLFALAFLRYSIAALTLSPGVIFSKEKYVLTARQIGSLLFLGFVVVFLFSFFFFSALQYSSATSVSLIASINPILTMCLSACITHYKPTWQQLVAFMLSFIGVLLVITEGRMDLVALSCGKGELFMLLAVLCQIVYAFSLKRLSNHFSPVFLACATGLTGTLFIVPLIINESLMNIILHLTGTQWAALGFMGIAGTALDLFLYSIAIKHMGPERTHLILFSSTPVFVFILAALILGETTCVSQILGGILIIASLLIGLRHAH